MIGIDMQVPLEVYFHNVDRSEAVEAEARARVDELERFAPEIISCRVTIEAPHRHSRKGEVYRVAVYVRVPGAEIFAGREEPDNPAHEDVYVAMRHAFDAARRQLQDRVRLDRGKVKVHEGPPRGTISELHPEKSYGRIATPDGRDIYFHRNSVVDADFDDLAVGDEVWFSEEEGDEGPQASTVHVVGKQP
ncbi:MAG TPA: HPF/RaiA family ribosome-associated protein [Gammaproteobacteria bacterium]